jgi:D-arabinose 1-dehydrogenase-like Zn-dependent alcohol dehydrogenase
MTQKFPLVPGHEVVGRVVEVGKEVKRFKAGDRVGRGWHGSHCFQCDGCAKGSYINCSSSLTTGITTDGGYAQYMVAPFESLARVPEGLKAEEAAPLLCAGLTCYNAFRLSGARAGDLVAIQGVGGLGHMGIQIAHKMGFEVAALSTSAAKTEDAKKLGAHHYIDTSKGKASEALQKLGGARIIMQTATDSKATADLINGLGADGELLIAGADFNPFPVSGLSLIMGRKKIVGCYSGHAMDAQEFLKFANIHGIKSMSEVYPLEKAEEAYKHMLTNKARFRVVLQPWPQDKKA